MTQAEYTRLHLQKTLLSKINKMEAEIDRLKQKVQTLEVKECLRESDEWEEHLRLSDERFEEQQRKLEGFDI